MKLNRERIVKALECLASNEDVLCGGCAYQRFSGLSCRKAMARDALALIRELTEENEKLTINMNAYGLTAERLAKENEILSAYHKAACDAVKIDTVRKMQERLKATPLWFVDKDTIDQSAKELLEEGK